MSREFVGFNKIPRLSREVVVTEKLDGTNASIYIGEDDEFLVGSRTKWITPDNDNFGFARWAYENEEELRKLGYGHHFGEWWGKGIQRGYGLDCKKFSLFNTGVWDSENIPNCCSVVPVLYRGMFNTVYIDDTLLNLGLYGSIAAPEFMKPEGIVIYHTAARQYFKKTIVKDEEHKGK
jgi:hypothetical protein